MQDNEKQTVQDALNTLKANSTDRDEIAARMAAQAYANNAAMAQDAQPQQGAAFNANGAPEEQNVTAANDAEVQQAEIADATPEELAAEVAKLQGENSALSNQVHELTMALAAEHDKMLRAVAEADNVRKRAEQDVDRERKYALEKFVRSLMPVYDALEKALEFSDRNNEATKATIDGVENTLTLFLKEMSSFGVEPVDPTGNPFDPNFHQAVSMVPSTDVPNNHVLNTMQKGFTLNGRVVRPAMVIVAKGNK